jgi:hypothetical protein
MYSIMTEMQAHQLLILRRKLERKSGFFRSHQKLKFSCGALLSPLPSNYLIHHRNIYQPQVLASYVEWKIHRGTPYWTVIWPDVFGHWLMRALANEEMEHMNFTIEPEMAFHDH